jgi:two-component system response regulator VanR
MLYIKNSLTTQNGNSNGKRRILSVDDDPDITFIVKTGLEVNTFNDPELALSSFKPGLYDLALLDFRMPKMYGYELYDEMKKIDSKLKMCFMTATYSNYEELRAAFPTIEIECYIQKPVKIKDLVRRANSELEHK